jgi:hypothetical protein
MKIIQIILGTLDGYGRDAIFGLGIDGKVYLWDYDKLCWIVYSR